MSYPFPPYQDQLADSSGSIKSTFLTPPLTPLSSHEKPWKPASPDDSSLNMKRKHHKHDEQEQSTKTALQPDRGQPGTKVANPSRSSNMGQTTQEQPLTVGSAGSSGSVSPNGSPLAPASKANSASSNVGEPVCQRRWTLASKSQATRGFTPLRSTVKQTTVTDHVDSPAVITLRRATTKTTPRVDELTFFPEPTFSHEKTGLLSYLVSTFSLVGASTDVRTTTFTTSNTTSRSTLLDSNGVHPTITNPAATVCTETTVGARLTMPGNDVTFQQMRRCSTKFTSGSTSYEVIWDENDSASTGDQSRQSTVERRRSSLAVTSLEAQLARSTPSTPRAVKVNSGSSGRASRSSVNMFQEQILTPAKLDQIILPRLQHKTGLRDLPRSRGGRRKKSSTICSITVDDPLHQTLSANGERRPSTFAMEFFPPLASRRESSSYGQYPERLRNSSSDITKECAPGDSILAQFRPRLGSLIGSSGHMRKKSSAMDSPSSRRGSRMIQGVMSRLSSFASDSWFGEADTEPLLGSGPGRSYSHR